MIPVLLTIENVRDITAQYSFINPKTLFKPRDGQTILSGLNFALYGDSSLFLGKTELSFIHNGINYVLERDFSQNLVKLSSNDSTITDITEIDKFVKTAVGYSSVQWNDFVLADKEKALAEATNDVLSFFPDIFDVLRIDYDTLDNSAKDAEKRIASIASQIALLNSMNSENSSKIVDDMADAKGDIANIKVDIEKLNDTLVETRSLLKAKEEYDKVLEQLDKEKEKEPLMKEALAKINQSNDMTHKIYLYEKNDEINKENAELQKTIADLTATLKQKEKEIAKGEAALKQKEKTFIYYTEVAKELNIALDKLIKDNAENGILENEIKSEAENYYSDTAKTKEELESKITELRKNLATASTSLDDKLTAYNNMRYTYVKRQSIREGASYENIIDELTNRLQDSERNLNEKTALLQDLNDRLATNKGAVAVCEKQEKALLNSGETTDLLIDKYNGLEQQKQLCYRNQIAAMTVSNDLKALDKKIFENKDALNAYTEDITALENAKTTLLEYVFKSEDKRARQNQKLIDLKAKQQYFKEIDNTELGSLCPVCNRHIVDKTDISIENTRLSATLARHLEDLTKTQEILDEYREKLDKINVRLGDLKAKEKISSGYINSLNATKSAKIAVRDKLYAECGVSSHEELTEKVQNCIAEIKKNTETIAKINQITGVKDIANENIVAIEKERQTLLGKEIPALKDLISQLKTKCEETKTAYAAFKSELGSKTANSMMDIVLNNEKEEDTFITEINTLSSAKNDLENRLTIATAEYENIISHKSTINKNGKAYTYPQLLINISSERYNEILSEIRKTETLKQAAQDEFVAVSRVLKNKKDDFNKLAADADTLLQRAENNTEYITKLNENGNFDPTALATIDLNDMRNSIISEEEKAELNKQLGNHTLRMGSLTYQSDALSARLSDGQELIAKYNENVLAYRNLQDLLYKREEESSDLVKKLAISHAIESKLTDLYKDKVKNEASLSVVRSALQETIADDFVIAVNSAIKAMQQNFFFKANNRSLNMHYHDAKGNIKSLDKPDSMQSTVASIAVISATDKILGDIFNTPNVPRIVTTKAGMLKDEDRNIVFNYAQTNNIVVLNSK